MDAEVLLSDVEDEMETELSRLGSSKAMYAVTGGEMEGDVVLEAMADAAVTAATTFESWAQTDPDETAADAFEAAADEQRAHAERIAADLDGYDPTDTPTQLDAHLREVEGTVARAAGFLGWALVSDRTLSQAVGFFIGNADTRRADLFRELRSDLAGRTDRALALLDACCDDDWDSAHSETVATIEAAYAHYVEALERMGIKVKPVC